jgi:hypothetical protein
MAKINEESEAGMWKFFRTSIMSLNVDSAKIFVTSRVHMCEGNV